MLGKFRQNRPLTEANQHNQRVFRQLPVGVNADVAVDAALRRVRSSRRGREFFKQGRFADILPDFAGIIRSAGSYDSIRPDQSDDRTCAERYRTVELREVGRIKTGCLLYTSPSPRDGLLSRMPSSA